MNTNLAPQALTDIKIYQKLMEREMRVLVGYKLRAEEWNTRLNGYKDNHDEYDFTELKNTIE